MSAVKSPGPPGGHPHADRPNWAPATTIEDYLRNCSEGLEEYSLRRVAKLLGVPRIELQRWILMAELPEGLFENLLAADIRSSRALANIALAAKRGNPHAADIEWCPHCGGLLRQRWHIPKAAREAIRAWLQAP